MAIGLYHRSSMGSNHGYAAVWSVLWNVNSSANCQCIQSPPVGVNWAIGTTASLITGVQGKCCPFVADQGIIEPAQGYMEIPSLYLAQLRQRLAALGPAGPSGPSGPAGPMSGPMSGMSGSGLPPCTLR
eukprot:TRINITY_DN16176_c0_g1_i1.p1 TRINITY_DN16176_c0_g1~~TRINITY_DN16176_c0_g1_i1.p1  ORF type:complete len:143 (+),score=26.44 TRINITY_DN16176_c0_g1_i1:43-429(+)